MRRRIARIVVSCCIACVAALCTYVGVMEFIFGGTGLFGYLWTLMFALLALVSGFDALTRMRP